MLRKIRLELARTPNAPDGRPSRGFTLVAPLTEDGHLDPKIWEANKSTCHVTRFDGSKEHRHGLLDYIPSSGESLPIWSITYEDGSETQGFRFETERFIPGEYVSLSTDDREARPFRVVSVVPFDQLTPQRTHL